jgi:hypothetical protein
VWTLLGTFQLDPGQNHRVEIADQASGGTYVVADVVAFERVDAPPATAMWTPALTQADLFDVYGRWPVDASAFSSNVTYKVVHQGGSATTTVSQKTGSGAWKLFAAGVTMAPGEGHRLEVPGVGDDTYVAADAAKFVPAAGTRRAIWDIAVGETGSYRVYAKWPGSNSHATDAPYTVTHAGGTTTVTVNQRVNGGTWNLLGTFAFEQGGSGYQVELTDDAASGRVAADAIYYVAEAAVTDAFTWTPAIPSSGTYTVYARWPASSANTATAQYAVTHAGGTSEVTLNQKQNGGAWMPLGSWSFAPDAGHKVMLTAAAVGTTIADALLFVGPGGQPANLLYIHADHLGSPQKLTDASQATVWDGVFDPFGEEVAIAGLAAMPMRFPGQYADDETGYSYNYFRDYDPYASGEGRLAVTRGMVKT